ncbi:MAG: hypothetical protein BWX73_01414 [Lentisphaerae bacterium ADurb.Bin082]|nr:MAG: hypothetical protein BWX73_01414 [Lentisphaerae bacterium ADurb.Bin082]
MYLTDNYQEQTLKDAIINQNQRCLPALTDFIDRFQTADKPWIFNAKLMNSATCFKHHGERKYEPHRLELSFK